MYYYIIATVIFLFTVFEVTVGIVSCSKEHVTMGVLLILSGLIKLSIVVTGILLGNGCEKGGGSRLCSDC
ncbi:unnamed protein product [Hymenolepis diminuta]|uniref:FXYD domain-containing ion transport regulator n=1 Tax=Hymenolepis diminuta TaxID=6216 RepID=A0A0R3SNM3_HYMDI|nr:unnamed protein product [Hymenolepis diminuta]VUZ49882.1 unnamed protein product [Hymenolepis diminuta]